MKQETAVNWLAGELKGKKIEGLKKLIAKAREMEKNQIIYAYYFARLIDQEKAGMEAREYFGKVYGDKT
jgi:hypothetical protein